MTAHRAWTSGGVWFAAALAIALVGAAALVAFQAPSQSQATSDPCDISDPLGDPDIDGISSAYEVQMGTDPCNDDTDADRCFDGNEIWPSPDVGGDRAPLTSDFFDASGEGVIDLTDALMVLDHFGEAPLETNRHLDRYVPNAAKPWRVAQANDGIDLQDALASLASFGHNCSQRVLLPQCPDGMVAVKFDSPFGPGTIGPITVTNVVYVDNEPRSFDWVSTVAISVVYVKSSTTFTTYIYDPPAFSGTALLAPEGPEGPRGISFVLFCYLPDQPTVTPTSTGVIGSATATPQTATVTHTPTPTLTSVPTETPTIASATPTETSSATATTTHTTTPTNTATPIDTATSTASATDTATATQTPTATATETNTPTLTATPVTPTATHTAQTGTPTVTQSASPTTTATLTPTGTVSIETATPQSSTPTPTATPTGTASAETSTPQTSTATTTATPTGPSVVKTPDLANLFLCDDSPVTPADECALNGEGQLTIQEIVDGVTEPLGAWEIQVKFDHKIFNVQVAPNEALFTDNGRVPNCGLQIVTENWILFGCVSTGPPDAGYMTAGGIPVGPAVLATLTLTPNEDLRFRLHPGNDNGVVRLILDENCEVTNTLGHPQPGSINGGLAVSCTDASVTVRILEGDLNLDCKVDVADEQAIAGRYGTFFGSILYDPWYDLEPALKDFDIDIKDVQKVFGRDGSTCENPSPPQPPVPGLSVGPL